MGLMGEEPTGGSFQILPTSDLKKMWWFDIRSLGCEGINLKIAQ